MTPQLKRRKPSTGKRKPPAVTLARCAAWQAPLAPAEGVPATHAAETTQGGCTGEKSGGSD
jgi:hypothetical protein